MVKRKQKELPPLPPEYVIVDCGKMLGHMRTHVTPPYTAEEIDMIKQGWFVGYRFLQENGLTTRTLVSNPDNLENFVFRVKDVTEEGLRFIRTSDSPFGRYQAAIGRNFTQDPEKKAKRILEPGLKLLRNARER